MAVWGSAIYLRVLGALSNLARVARHPKYYLVAVEQTHRLIEEFMDGGVVIDSGIPLDFDVGALQAVIVRTVVQADGDVQLIVNRSLRDLSAERQFEVLEEHFRVVALRLAPLTYMAELTAALRAAIRLIATLGLVGSVAFHSNVGILWALGAAVSSTLLLFFPSVARKLLWWWLKWRIAHSAWVG